MKIAFEVSTHRDTGSKVLGERIKVRTLVCFGNPDGYLQFFWTWGKRAYCLSFRHGFQSGRYVESGEELAAEIIAAHKAKR